MSFYKFSKNEIERLCQIQDKLQLKYESLNYSPQSDKNDEELQEYIEGFIESMNAYQERFDLFKYQIFILVTAENWEERLSRWVENICPESETLYHHYFQLYSLYAWICCIIPFSQRTVPERIRNALFETFGYEEGIEKIKKLLIHETDEVIKSDLELFVGDDIEISDYKIEIVRIIQSEETFKELENLTQSLKLLNWELGDIIKLLRKLSNYLYYHPAIKKDELLIENIYDYIELLEK